MTQPISPSTRVAILGTVGIPARYGGFETLAESLAVAAAEAGHAERVTVLCSGPSAKPPRPIHFRGVRLHYVPLRANGMSSIAYDIWGLLWAARTQQDAVLLLGVSGALALPLFRRLSRARLVVHVDGIEWHRPKWRGMARAFLRWSERSAIRHADAVIADNPEIAKHIRDRYGRDCVEIAYGSDHAHAVSAADVSDLGLPTRYALTVARIEPENNIELILSAFSDQARHPLVIVGNWSNSAYGRRLRAAYGDVPNLSLIDAEYDAGRLRAIRNHANIYVHGHSAGGTNPSLVEMMAFGIPIAAYDCAFNRETTGEAAAFFSDAESLRRLIPVLEDPRLAHGMGAELAAIARRRYRWADVTARYFACLGLPTGLPSDVDPAYRPQRP